MGGEELWEGRSYGRGGAMGTIGREGLCEGEGLWEELREGEGLGEELQEGRDYGRSYGRSYGRGGTRGGAMGGEGLWEELWEGRDYGRSYGRGGAMGGEELCRRGECLQISVTISTHENLFTCSEWTSFPPSMTSTTGRLCSSAN